jgi:hypothetical protein
MDVVTWAREEAERKLASELPRRWAHVQGVARRAAEAAPLFDSDEGQLLVGAAFVHDIGYSPELNTTGFHPLDGARYLRRIGAPDRLVNLVARHSSAYKEAQMRGLSNDLAAFPDDESAVRDALWWADMTTTPDGDVTTIDQRIAEIQVRYGAEDVVASFIQQAESELTGAVSRTIARLDNSGIDYA